jgi:hypothetical protein
VALTYDSDYPNSSRENAMPSEKRETTSIQEMVVSNMLTLNALVELFDEKGPIARQIY